MSWGIGDLAGELAWASIDRSYSTIQEVRGSQCRSDDADIGDVPSSKNVRSMLHDGVVTSTAGDRHR